MRVIVTAGYIAEFPFGDQAACHGAGGANNALCRVAFKSIGIAAQVNRYAVNLDLLADIPGDDIGIVAALCQVIIFLFCRFIGEVKRFGQVGLDDFIIRVKRKEKLMERPDMVTRLYCDIVLSVGGKSFQRLPVKQDIQLVLSTGDELLSGIFIIAQGNKIPYDQDDGKTANMLEGGFDIFHFFKHGLFLVCIFCCTLSV